MTEPYMTELVSNCRRDIQTINSAMRARMVYRWASVVRNMPRKSEEAIIYQCDNSKRIELAVRSAINNLSACYDKQPAELNIELLQVFIKVLTLDKPSILMLALGRIGTMCQTSATGSVKGAVKFCVDHGIILRLQRLLDTDECYWKSLGWMDLSYRWVIYGEEIRSECLNLVYHIAQQYPEKRRRLAKTFAKKLLEIEAISSIGDIIGIKDGWRSSFYFNIGMMGVMEKYRAAAREVFVAAGAVDRLIEIRKEYAEYSDDDEDDDEYISYERKMYCMASWLIRALTDLEADISDMKERGL